MKKEPSTVDLTDAQLDRLLAGRDQLSVREKEQALERVLARTARHTPGAAMLPRMIPRWGFAFAGLALLVPVVLFFARSRWQGELTARGGGALAPTFEVSCLSGSGETASCTRGDRMVFWISPGRFRAFAALALAPDGKTLWYFPNDESATSVDLAGSKWPGMLGRAAVIDGSHVPGSYSLYGVFSSEPLSKEQIRRAIQNAGSPGVVVVRRALQVAERGAP
jgi:hypothetical protein